MGRSLETCILALEDHSRITWGKFKNWWVYPLESLGDEWDWYQVPYLKDADQHDFGHQIHTFRFAADVSPEQERKMYPKEMKTRKALGIDDPLRGMKAGTDFCESTLHPKWLGLIGVADYMFQCELFRIHVTSDSDSDWYSDFLKVVSTSFVYLGGDEIPSHQYSVTRYERNLREGNAPGRDEHGRTSLS
jgi:hypothetical protein